MKTAEEITRAYWKAEESRDLDRIIAFFTTGAEWRGPGVRATGHEAIRPIYATSIAAYPELEVTVQRVLGGDREAALEYSAVFRDAGGGERRLNGVNLILVDGQRIVSLTTYFDPAQLA
jgi:ketosteroid isomerase-like protein